MKFKRDDFYILEGIADDFAGGGFVTPEDLAAVALSGKYSDLSGAPSLGTASAEDVSAFATASQGSLASSAVQPGDLSTVATSGEYSDLSGTPSLGSLATLSSVSDAQVASGANIALSKLANVAAGTDGLAAGTIQATLQSLATRIQALEDAVV